MQFDMTFAQFLNWLLYGGGSVLASSWILERFTWFQNLATESKQWVFFGSASLLSTVAYSLITYAPKFVEAAQPYFFILGGTFVLVFLGKVFHFFDKNQ